MQCKLLIDTTIGPDHTQYKVSDNGQHESQPIDEIEDYYSAQYLSAGQAAWQIMGFKITCKDPSVTAVSVHLPGTNTLGTHVCHFQDLTFAEYFSTFHLKKYNPTNNTRPMYFRESHTDGSHSPEMHVILCNSSHWHLSQIDGVCPLQGELFYLHWILQHQPALSFEDAHTIDDHLFGTYQEAATAMGLFADENKGIYALREAIKTLHTPQQLWILLIHLLVNNLLPMPINVWNNMHEHFALNFTLQNSGLVEIGVYHALQELTTYLEEYGKQLADYGLSEPDSCLQEVEHEMVH